MLDDLNIFRAAKLLINQHGTHAVINSICRAVSISLCTV
jgi:hypothetical protein